jgi:quinol-cytochrome oxidoreductase complex cytochrome b subunit
MIILILSIYHLYPPWYFTTIYAEAVGNASLSLKNIFTTHSQTTFMFRKPCRNQNSNQYNKLITFARAGCVRTFTTKKIIISHFLLRIVNLYAYGVYISQFMLYSRVCGSCHVFRDRCLLLTRNILNSSFLVVK